MFSISQISFNNDLNTYLFCADSPTPIILEVLAENQNDFIGKQIYAFVNGVKFYPILFKDINETNNVLTKDYILNLDSIIKYYMSNCNDFNQSLDSEVEVSNMLSYFDIRVYIQDITTKEIVSNILILDCSFIRSSQQFGERGYIAQDNEFNHFISETSEQTPAYNYDTYNAVTGIPYYIYFLANSNLDAYYNFYIGGKFENKYAENHNSTKIFTNESGINFII